MVRNNCDLMTIYAAKRLPWVVVADVLILDCGIYGRRAVFSQEATACLSMTGELFIPAGFAYDGASGPTWDTRSISRGAAAHDVLYGMISAGSLPMSARRRADALLRKCLVKDGCHVFRAWYYWSAVRIFGRLAVRRKMKS